MLRGNGDRHAEDYPAVPGDPALAVRVAVGVLAVWSSLFSPCAVLIHEAVSLDNDFRIYRFGFDRRRAFTVSP